MKKFWCHYTCDPRKTDFVTPEWPISDPKLPIVNFFVDEDMACTLYKSCNKVALISQASIQSSRAFLTFLSTNGKSQSHTQITFNYTSPDPSKHRVKTNMYPCDYTVPSDGMVEGYANVTNGTCSFCDTLCKPPIVDSSISFFDGFGATKGIVAATFLVVFSGLW